MQQQGAAVQLLRAAVEGPGTLTLTIFCRKDFLICDQFLTKTHYKVDVLRSSALSLLPLLVIPVVYSTRERQRKQLVFNQENNNIKAHLITQWCHNEHVFKECLWFDGE